MEGNYDKILEKISRSSGVEKEEIERRIEAKRAKLSGLISREGAAQVIAAELGVNFDGERLKLDELLPGMRKVNCIGKVINIFPVRTFVRNGQENKVANFIIADEKTNVKVVLWDTNHIGLIETGEVADDSVVEIVNGSVKEGEIHLGSFSELKLSKEDLGDVITEKVVHQKNISDFKTGDNLSVRAFVLQIFDPKFFYVCPECKKKPSPEGESFVCAEHGKILPEKRALVNIVIDDGTETIRSVLFHEAIPKLGIVDLEKPEALITQRENVLGKEMIFSGNVRNNSYFNRPEFIISDVKDVNFDELMKGLENKKI